MTTPLNTKDDATVISHPALSSGVKTSEFWLSILTVAVLVIGAFVPDTVAQKWASEHGWIGGLVVAVYIAARAYIKATALKVL